jgi:hypothetical protein
MAQLSVWREEIVLAEAEVKAGKARLKCAHREHQAILDEVGDMQLGSTDGEPGPKRAKSSRGRGSKAMVSAQPPVL